MRTIRTFSLGATSRLPQKGVMLSTLCLKGQGRKNMVRVMAWRGSLQCSSKTLVCSQRIHHTGG